MRFSAYCSSSSDRPIGQARDPRPPHSTPVLVRDQKQLRILLIVIAGFLVGFGLLLFLIATDV